MMPMPIVRFMLRSRAANVNDITDASDADRAGRQLRLRPRLLRLRLVGRARCRRMPDRHPFQVQHAARRGRRTGGRRRRQHPLRPHRLPAPAPSQKPLNPMRDPVREVRVRIDTGKVLRILSNDLDASAQEIADLYRRRWAIELFFRWVKQTLKIAHFVGTSENAIRIQIAVALIAFLLLRLAQAAQKAHSKSTRLRRLIRANLMHRRQIDHLLTTPPKIAQDQTPDDVQHAKLNRTAVGLTRASTLAIANRRSAWMAGSSPRLSGSFFLDKAHGVDSSVFQAFGDVLGHGEGSSHASSE